MIERADNVVESGGNSFSLLGNLGNKVEEQLGVLKESGEALLGNKFAVYAPMLERLQTMVANVESQSSELFEQLSGPLQPLYNRLSGVFGSGVLGSFLDSDFHERERFGIVDELEINHLKSIKDDDPEKRSRQIEFIRTLFYHYENTQGSTEGDTLAQLLIEGNSSEHPLNQVRYENIVTALENHISAGGHISAEYLYSTGWGSQYVEKNGEELSIKSLSRQNLREICKNCIMQVRNPDVMALLRITKSGDSVDGLDYANTFVSGVFSALVGMNPNHVFYNTDDIQTQLTISPEESISNHEGVVTETDAGIQQNIEPEPIIYSGNLDLSSLDMQAKLSDLSFEQASILATRIFGAGPATDLLIKLSGGYPDLITRVIALGNHEGGLKFARTNVDPNTASGQINWGTFQLSAKPAAIVHKVNRGLSRGVSMLNHYGISSSISFDPLPSYRALDSESHYTKAQYDLLAWLGFAKNRLGRLADPSLTGDALANYISDRVQVGISAIGHGVNQQLAANSSSYYLGRSDLYENIA